MTYSHFIHHHKFAVWCAARAVQRKFAKTIFLRDTLEKCGIVEFMLHIKPDFVNAMKISKQANIDAYDAYFLDCAIRYKAPILTLDRELRSVAQKIKVAIVEV